MSQYEFDWPYPEPFEDCPVCGKCGNWFWLGMCGLHPRKKAPSLGGFKGQESTQGATPEELDLEGAA